MYKTTKFEQPQSRVPVFPKLTRQSVILHKHSPRNNSTLGEYGDTNTQQILIQNQQHSQANPGFSSMGSAATFESGANISSQLGSPSKNKVLNDFLPIGTLLSLGHGKMMPSVEGELPSHLNNHILYSGLTDEQMLTMQSGIKLRAGQGSQMASAAGQFGVQPAQSLGKESQQILGVNFMAESSAMRPDNHGSKDELNKAKAKTIATEIVLKSNKNFKKKDAMAERDDKSMMATEKAGGDGLGKKAADLQL